MCEPVSIALGVLSSGLQIMQQQAAVAAQNKTIDFQNLQAEQQFEYQTLQASSARAHEQQQRLLQEDAMSQVSALANDAYAEDINAINSRIQQEMALAGQQKRETGIAALEAKGAILAAGKYGHSIQNLIADVQRKQGYFDYATNRNLAFTVAQKQQEKRGAGITKASRIASQQPYLERTILDPMQPIPRQHVSGPGFAGFLSAGLQGVSTGFSTAAGIKQAGFTYTPGGGYTR